MAYKNGEVPLNQLTTMYNGQRLTKEAAASYEALNRAYSEGTTGKKGVEKGEGRLVITEGYRDLARQKKLRADYLAGRGNLAAVPGTSIHGIGTAVDFGGMVARRGTKGHNWMLANAGRFGWVWTGGNFKQIEPWHWEYKGGYNAGGNSGSGAVANDTVKAQQAWMNQSRGEKLVVDGIKGPAYAAANKRYQTFLRGYGYTGAIDGIWGSGEQAAHQKYYDAWHKPAAPAPSGKKTTASFGSVLDVQRALKTKYPAYAGKLVLDGKDGPATKAAVKEFQRRSGLTPDGIAGPATRKKLGL